MVKCVEVRRHAMRHKSLEGKISKHLSNEGIELARKVGYGFLSQQGEYALFKGAWTSQKSRAIETSLCMGFEVDVIDKRLAHYPEKIYKKSGWPKPFKTMLKACQKHKSVAGYARKQAKILHEVVDDIEDGQSTLVISHGGIMELMLLGLVLGETNLETRAQDWGDVFNYGEGFRVVFEDDNAFNIEILRLTNDISLI